MMKLSNRLILVYTEKDFMKKHIVLAFFVLFSLVPGGVFAAGEVLGATTTNQKDAPLQTEEVKQDPLSIKKQKIEADLRTTISKLKAVIERTSLIIEVLGKKGLDMKAAIAYLVDAKAALDEANTALDQFVGVQIPETKSDTKTLKALETKPSEAKTTQALKDPLKKAEESLKDSKNTLISSISAIKDAIATKDSAE